MRVNDSESSDRKIPKRLKEKLSHLNIEMKKKIVSEFLTFGIQLSPDEIEQFCVDLFREFLTAATNGKCDVDLTTISINHEPCDPALYTDDLKPRYGAALLTEVSNRCPCANCSKQLVRKTNGISAHYYEIVQINPKFSHENIDNLIAMCPECASQYKINLKTDCANEYISRLEDIKLKLSSIQSANEAVGRIQIKGNEIERVIQKFSQIFTLEADGAEPRYVPSKIDQKIGESKILALKIRNQVVASYQLIEQIFLDFDRLGYIDYDLFSAEIRYAFKQYLAQGLSNENIFEELVGWLSTLTNEDKTFCEPIISFFVQKCEVFNPPATT